MRVRGRRTSAGPGDSATLFAAFGSMYFSVISMSDAEHRRQFFAPVLEKVERTLEVRAVYLEVRGREQV